MYAHIELRERKNPKTAENQRLMILTMLPL